MICLIHLLHSSEGISEEDVLAAFRLFWESVLDEVESTEEEDEGDEEAAVLASFRHFWESVSDEVECTEEADGISAEVDQVESAEEPEEAASVSDERLHCINRLFKITEKVRRDLCSLETLLKNIEHSSLGLAVPSQVFLFAEITRLSAFLRNSMIKVAVDFDILVKRNLPAAGDRVLWTMLGGLKERVREDYGKIFELRQQCASKFEHWDNIKVKFEAKLLVSAMDRLGKQILGIVGSSFLMESHSHMYSNNILENMKLGEEVENQGATDEEV